MPLLSLFSKIFTKKKNRKKKKKKEEARRRRRRRIPTCKVVFGNDELRQFP
jgi:hypothetical protein